MRSLSTARFTLPLLWVHSGCSGNPRDSDTSSVEADADTDADSDTDTDVEPTGGTLAGRAAYTDGANPQAVRAQMCVADLCVPGLHESDGSFTVVNLAPDAYAFELVPLSGDEPGRTYATPLDIVRMDEAPGAVRTLAQAVQIPTWTDIGALAAGDFTSGRLTLTADPSTFTPYEDGSAVDFIAAVELDSATAGLPLDMLQDEGEVVGLWFLGPFRAEVGTWTFSVADTGLPEGTSLRAFNAHYESVRWIDLGTLTVDAGGTAVADGGTGLVHLTTLVLVREAE